MTAPGLQSRGALALRAAGHVLLLGVAAGLITGSLHVLVLLTMRLGFGRLVFYSRDSVWMAPLGNALIFVALAVLPVAGSVVLRFRIPPSLAAGAFTFLSVFTLLLPFDAIWRWVSALVALACAVQLGRQVSRAPERWLARARRVVLGIGAAVVAVLVGQAGVRALRRTLAVHALKAADSGQPNVLLVIWDTVRAEELTLYGYPRPTTPNLVHWAAQGVVFDYAISTAPWTLPSHWSLLSGELNERSAGEWLRPVSSTAPTLAETLRDRGYLTAGFAANLLYTTYESGLSRGFLDYQDYPRSMFQVLYQCPLLQTVLAQSLLGARARWEVRRALQAFQLKIDRYPADEYVSARVITDRFLGWQADVRDRPFFAFLNYFDAHGPYRSPAEFQARLAPDGKQQGRYDAAIGYLDAELDRMLRELEARGVLQHTLVIVAADHGELFGEHGLRGHANGLYLPLLRVPLVLRYPEHIPAGLRVPGPVSLRDVPATILDLAGGVGGAPLHGQSLVQYWAADPVASPPSPIVSAVAKSREVNRVSPNLWTGLESLLDARYHYIRSGLGKEELFAWRTDPLELSDLAPDAASAPLLASLRVRLGQATGTERTRARHDGPAPQANVALRF